MSKYLDKIDRINLQNKEFQERFEILISLQKDHENRLNELKGLYKKVQYLNAVNNKHNTDNQKSINESEQKIKRLILERDGLISKLKKRIDDERTRIKQEYKATAEEILKKIIIIEEKSNNNDVESVTEIEQLEIKCLTILRDEREFVKKCKNNEDNVELQSEIKDIFEKYSKLIEIEENNTRVETTLSSQDNNEIIELKKTIGRLEAENENLKNRINLASVELNKTVVSEQDLCLDDDEINLVTDRKDGVNDKLPENILLCFTNKEISDLDNVSYTARIPFYYKTDGPIFVFFDGFNKSNDTVAKILYKICENVIIDSISNTYFDSIKYIFIDKNMLEGNIKVNMYNIGRDLEQYKKYDIIEIFKSGIKTSEIIENYLNIREKEIGDVSIDNKNSKLKQEGSSLLIKNNILFARFYDENDCEYQSLKYRMNQCKFYGVLPILFFDIECIRNGNNELRDILGTYTNGNYLRIVIGDDRNIVKIIKLKI